MAMLFAENYFVECSNVSNLKAIVEVIVKINYHLKLMFVICLEIKVNQDQVHYEAMSYHRRQKKNADCEKKKKNRFFFFFFFF